MNLIPPSSVNNIQDYFKNLYKVEYNNENRSKKREKNIKKDKENNNEGINLKIINEDNKRINANKINEIKNIKNWEESIEEIHYYYVHMVQSGKNLEKKLNKK